MNSLKWYLFILVPIILVAGLWEDIANEKSPRRGWWKNRILNIPDFEEWLMFEAANAAEKQINDERKATQKESEKKDPGVK